MLYFILWILFLAAVLLAVPLAWYIEKRKLRAAYANRESAANELDEPGGEGADGDAIDQPGAMGAGEPAPGDAFADFEELK